MTSSKTFTRRRFSRNDCGCINRSGIRALRPHRTCRRQACGRFLGPLGARRQRHAHEDLQRMGGEGKGRHYSPVHNLSYIP
jgi:hypothetical protein